MSYYSTCPDCGAHLDPCEVCDCHMEIDGVKYPVTGLVHHERLGPVPVVDMPTMSDYQWQKSCLEDRIKNPELYRRVLHEDVEAVIARLYAWLKANKESAAQV